MIIRMTKKGEIVDRYSSLFTEYITPCAQNWPIASYFEPRRLENIVVSGQLQQMPYDILCLEFGPRSEVIAWANRYVASHRDRKFILLTHEFLTRNGERINKGSYAELQLRNTSYSTPEQLWQKLIKNNDNILCVLCGHNGFMQHLFSKKIQPAGRLLKCSSICNIRPTEETAGFNCGRFLQTGIPSMCKLTIPFAGHLVLIR